MNKMDHDLFENRDRKKMIQHLRNVTYVAVVRLDQYNAVNQRINQPIEYNISHATGITT